MSSRERERFDEIGKKIKRDAAAECSELHYHNPMAGRSSRSQMMMMMGHPPGTLNTITPCAACKLLRRRCAQECPFSPYFSPHEPHKFASVHKVFGASNVSKMLMEVAESQRADAANSLVYEANVRLRDPVYGCMGAISALQQQIQASQAELHAVRAHIIRFKHRQSDILIPLPPPPQHITGDLLPSSSAAASQRLPHEAPAAAVEFADMSSENSQYFLDDHHHHV